MLGTWSSKNSTITYDLVICLQSVFICSTIYLFTYLINKSSGYFHFRRLDKFYSLMNGRMPSIMIAPFPISCINISTMIMNLSRNTYALSMSIVITVLRAPILFVKLLNAHDPLTPIGCRFMRKIMASNFYHWAHKNLGFSSVFKARTRSSVPLINIINWLGVCTIRHICHNTYNTHAQRVL